MLHSHACFNNIRCCFISGLYIGNLNFIKRPYDSDTKLVFSDLLLNFHFYVCLSTNTNAVSGKTVNLAKMTTNSVFLVMVGGQIESGEVGISL